MSLIRLDKFICDNTEYSRSQIKELIRKGTIKVDGVCVKKSDIKINPDENTVETPLGQIEYKKYTYIILNKPTGYVCSTDDPDSPTVLELVPPEMRVKGLFPAGRLDKDSIGMVLLTNDGALSHKILAPKSHIPKYYVVKLAEPLKSKSVDLFSKGIILQNGEVCLPAKVKPIENHENWAFIEICEGKYHQVKRMFASVENHVEILFRFCMGNLQIPEKLKESQCIEVMHKDVERLLESPDFDLIYQNLYVYFSSYLINK